MIAPDDMCKMVNAQREAYKLHNAPRMSDYIWYAIGKVRVFISLTQRKLDDRMGAATWKIQQYRAVMRDYVRREEITKEAYHNGGCAK